MVGQNAIFAAIVIGFAVTIMGVFVWPFWNLIPEMVTEQTHVIAVLEDGHCAVETKDHYVIHEATCPQGAKPGDLIESTFDNKIKERMVQSIRRL